MRDDICVIFALEVCQLTLITRYQPSLDLHDIFVLREKKENNILREFHLSKLQSSDVVEKPRKVRITLNVPSLSR